MLETFIQQYGPWLGLLVYVLLKDLIPFMKDKFLPAQMKAAEDERTARLNELAEERKWHRQMESERLTEMRTIASAVQAIQMNLVQVNADNSAIRANQGGIVTNQQTIISKVDHHHNTTMDAITEMREEVARRRGLEEGKRLPKTGPMGGEAANK